MPRRMPGRTIAIMFFLVERYWPGVTHAGFRNHVASLERFGRGPSEPDPGIIHLGSVLVSDDEVVLSFFRAPSLEALRAQHERSDLAPDRILEVVGLRGDAT